MNKTITLLLATTALAIGAPAIAADQTYKAETKIERDDDGDFKREISAERKTESGRVASEVATEVDIDEEGDGTRTVTTKDVNDPKGLLNKDTVKTKQTTKVENGKVTSETRTTKNGEVISERSSNRTSY